MTKRSLGEGVLESLKSGEGLAPLLRCTELFRLRTGSQRKFV
ncbi:hypothetical protein RISK_002537 [Rhodopirellula islandica]|uniref:Uncharacterized protein n=1 Tax=Rhodopirellula islandica TaxID=595434 RepID=A0A0J1BFW5_RHOIS|nr:hypothetical protein RISK_002537 [Rhodopirellula islandica]